MTKNFQIYISQVCIYGSNQKTKLRALDLHMRNPRSFFHLALKFKAFGLFWRRKVKKWGCQNDRRRFSLKIVPALISQVSGYICRGHLVAHFQLHHNYKIKVWIICFCVWFQNKQTQKQMIQTYVLTYLIHLHHGSSFFLSNM